jgi:hypothetical protein
MLYVPVFVEVCAEILAGAALLHVGLKMNVSQVGPASLPKFYGGMRVRSLTVPNSNDKTLSLSI